MLIWAGGIVMGSTLNGPNVSSERLGIGRKRVDTLQMIVPHPVETSVDLATLQKFMANVP